MSDIQSYQVILSALSRAKVRFLVAGGIAMNIHGLSRSTFDLDLIVFLDEKNVLKVAPVLRKLGYRPNVPVKIEDFANKSLRKQWIEEKNMIVFSLYNEKNPLDVVDIFVDHPRPFDQMFKASKKVDLLGQTVYAVGLQDMLFMKKKANRPKDQFDIRFLEAIIRKQEDD